MNEPIGRKRAARVAAFVDDETLQSTADHLVDAMFDRLVLEEVARLVTAEASARLLRAFSPANCRKLSEDSKPVVRQMVDEHVAWLNEYGAGQFASMVRRTLRERLLKAEP